VEVDEYRRMAEVETSHWWYGATRALLGQLLAPHLAAHLASGPGAGRPLVLDAGSGTGATGAWMAHAGVDRPAADVVACDFEPLALQLYREAHPALGLAVGDVTRLPLRADWADLTLCVTVLCHRSIAEPADAVRELVRVTRPGGVVCLVEPGVRRLRRAHDRVTHTARRFARSDLAALLSQAGAEPLRATGAYAFLVPPAAVKAVLERGRTASDLDRQQGGLGGVLPRLAALERRVLARVDLPFGLSVVALGRKSA
jgi:SAM-dependent methyltransferase